MNCKKCSAYMEDPQTGDDYCKEMDALISPGADGAGRIYKLNKHLEVEIYDRTGSN